MNETPRSNRLHIAIVGKRNAGKSSIINALTHQEVSIVSSCPGTTTDPVYKAMELHDLGPVVFIDTAGIDDAGDLGVERVKRTERVLDAADMALIVFTPGDKDITLEKEWIKRFQQKKVSVIGVVNKIDLEESIGEIEKNFKGIDIPFIYVSAKTSEGIDCLRDMIKKHSPSSWEEPRIVSDLIPPGSLVILVVPIDIEAPKGRLILPQVQTLRDILDYNSTGIVTKENTLQDTLKSLSVKPALVITDSQVFAEVDRVVPHNIPLTSFSILMARYKGDLKEFVRGIEAVKQLKEGNRVLIAEACTHHPVEDDIGREKIPRWLKKYVGAPLDFTWVSGKDFPNNLSEYDLVIHCGGCMINRREMLSRIQKCREAGVPIINYGIIIATMKGIIERAIQVFGIQV
jgi:[FeFe] hydrogenase H-cluster maturation GTPase HydF